MSSLASGTPSLNASEQCESILPAAPFALPAGSTAIVYCEGLFGEQDGKTANGLVRHSEIFFIYLKANKAFRQLPSVACWFHRDRLLRGPVRRAGR